MKPHSLSVLLICKNEADRIESCLQSVAGWADEIVVFDSGSTDGTIEIVQRYTDKLWSLLAMPPARIAGQKLAALLTPPAKWRRPILLYFLSDVLRIKQPMRLAAG